MQIEMGTPFSPMGLGFSGNEILIQRDTALERRIPPYNDKFMSPALRPMRIHNIVPVKIDRKSKENPEETFNL